MSQIYDIDLENLTGGSLLVTGFSRELPSWPLIAEAIRKQKKLLASGKGGDGGALGNTNQLDNNTYQTLVPPAGGRGIQQNPNGQP